MKTKTYNNEKPQRHYQLIAEVLYRLIRQESYKEGDRLPSERQLAQQLAVSRSLLREALIMLEILGLVEIRPGSGVYLIKSSGNVRFANSLIGLDDDVGPFEMLQARQVLESSVVEVAAWQVNKADIDAMQQTLDKERAAIQAGIIEDDNDRQFHLLIAQATRNSVLVDMVDKSWEQRENSPMWQQLHKHILDHSYRSVWADEHQEILNALKQKSPERAKAAMWQHLEHVRNTLFELGATDNPEFDGHLFPIYPQSTENVF